MKKIPHILLATMLLTALFFAGTSYAWLTDKKGGEKIQIVTGKTAAELAFALNTNYGIPGEVIAITAKESGRGEALPNINTLTNMGHGDYIFKITYTVSYDPNNQDSDAVPYIIGLKLADAEKARSDGNVLIADSYNKDSGSLVCYGRHSSQDSMELGELHAEFDIMKKTAMSKPFTVSAELIACQATAEAVEDIFGISASDTKYAALFPTTP